MSQETQPDDTTGLEGVDLAAAAAAADAENARAEETAAETDKAPEGMMRPPDFVTDIGNIYRSGGSHVFLLHGNVNDYPDNSGVRGDIGMTLFSCYDQYWQAEQIAEDNKRKGRSNASAPARDNPIKRIAARWSIPNGLEFATDISRNLFISFMREDDFYKQKPDDFFMARPLAVLLPMLNDYFRATAKRFHATQPFRAILADPSSRPADRSRAARSLQATSEISLTLVFYDARLCFPAGNVSNMQGDRTPLSYMESWALDGSIATRNKIIMIAPRASEVQASLRSGDARVSSIRIKRPDLAARKEWLTNFCEYIKTTPAMINGRPRKSVELDEDLTIDLLANQMAGMSRVQMEKVFMESWLRDVSVDTRLVAAHKKAAIEAEYGDILDIKQPLGGWKKLGGHDMLRQYADQSIVKPLMLGDRRTCTRGVMLSGPPGVGKSWFAECLAAECGMNFITVNFARLYGGIVGETERNTERLFDAIEAMAPCIVFADEIDSAFSNGRTASGDSGVSTRMFNRVMTWLSDDSRWGSVVVVMATNRPDLLDEAFIRAGRIDDIIPALPPGPGGSFGRLSIMKALCVKNNIRFDESIRHTYQNPQSGLGRMLLDMKIWTGAEQERVLNLAYSNAIERVRSKAEEEAREQGMNRHQLIEHIRQQTRSVFVNIDDWDRAMTSYRPRTQSIDLMIDLALYYANRVQYVPEEWRARMQDEDRMRSISARESGQVAHSYERA